MKQYQEKQEQIGPYVLQESGGSCMPVQIQIVGSICVHGFSEYLSDRVIIVGILLHNHSV